MKKLIFYAFLPMVVVTTALFVSASIAFENYTSSELVTKTEDMNIPINQDAPVKSHDDLVIDAPRQKVWELLTGINDWPQWQTEVTESHLKGELREGAEFEWKAGGLSFTSRIHTIEPGEKFGWTGKTFGASAVHNWFFRDEGDKTRVYVEESLQGVFPKLFGKYFQKKLDSGLRKNLMELKVASEKQKSPDRIHS
ncbi:SRPBCC family protein [Pseudozobellia thermophila]|nr:SRPBCC family protein [Pseudozobellia thermophila]